jgi:hypothetical protein
VSQQQSAHTASPSTGGVTEGRAAADRAVRTARRSLLAIGGVAGAGLAGLFTASPASAAGGDALRAGKTVDAGGGGTGLKANTGKVALAVTQRGSGTAVSVKAQGSGYGVRTSVAARGRAAVLAINAGPSTDPAGAGAAVLAQGQRNVGLRATTSSAAKAVPAVVATGAGGLGISLLATGKALLDGDVLALRNLVGVLDAAGELAYAHTSSGDHATHTRHGVVRLSGGSAAVALGNRFLKAVDLSTLAVQLTPVGGSMPSLTYTPTSTGFTISGGLGSGRVAWVAFADRFVLTLAAAKSSSAPAQGSGGAASSGTTALATGGSRSAAVENSGRLARRGTVRPRPEGVLD